MNEGKRASNDFDGSLAGMERHVEGYSVEKGEAPEFLGRIVSDLGKQLSHELQTCAKLKKTIDDLNNTLGTIVAADDPTRPAFEMMLSGVQTVYTKQQEAVSALRRVIDGIFRLSPDFIIENEVPEGSMVQ